MNAAIIGYGFVGQAMHKLFPDAYIYDVDRGTRADVNQADTAFVCVPTDATKGGKLDTSIVEDVVSWCQCPLLIIRSTVNPGTADYLERTYRRNIVVVPEYIGETVAHPLLDEKTRPFLIIGGRPANRRRAIEVFQTVYSANISIRQMSNLAAEITKLAENTAIAHKLACAQELYDACQAAGIDYYIVREAVFGDDPRQTLWHTFVYPDKRGMQSKCLPKDVFAFASWAEGLGASASVTKAILERNKEWIDSSAKV